MFYGGFILAMLAALLLTPALALWLARTLRPALKRLRPVEGALAADSLIQAPRRTSATVAALMLSLSLVIALGGLARASYVSIMDWVDTALNPDLFVTPTGSLTNRQFRFPGSMGDGLRAVAGHRRGAGRPQRADHVPAEAGHAGRARRWTAGTRGRGARRSRAARRRCTGRRPRAKASSWLTTSRACSGLKVGSMIELPAPKGVLRLPVAGIVGDWSDQAGAIFLDWALYTAYWNDDTVTTFRVYLTKGASVEKVKESILAKYAGVSRLFVLTNAEVRRYITGLTDQWMGLAYSQIVVAILVAILGIVNTLTVSIIDRRRELGVLQAVGALRSQLRHTIWMEALSIGARRAGARPGARCGQPVLRARDEPPRHHRRAAAVPVSVPDRGDPGAGDAGGGVRGGAVAGRVGGARVARAGARVRVGGAQEGEERQERRRQRRGRRRAGAAEAPEGGRGPARRGERRRAPCAVGPATPDERHAWETGAWRDGAE